MSPSDLDREVRMQIFRFFVENGRPPRVEEAADALAIARDEVGGTYERLAANRVMVLEPGTLDVRMANPLSAVPTPFPVTVAGKEFFGNCIWDALGVVSMLGSTGVVHSSCGCCGELMPLRVEDGAVQAAEGLVHFAVPALHWWDDIVYT